MNNQINQIYTICQNVFIPILTNELKHRQNEVNLGHAYSTITHQFNLRKLYRQAETDITKQVSTYHNALASMQAIGASTKSIHHSIFEQIDDTVHDLIDSIINQNKFNMTYFELKNQILYYEINTNIVRTYLILDKLDKTSQKHGYITQHTSDNAISVAPAKDELPYCELIQYDAKHINMILGSDFDNFANTAQDYDDITAYENSEIETKQKADQLMFIINLVKPYLA